jgi:hypothetical protein
MPGATFELLADYVGQEISFVPTAGGPEGTHKPELFGYTPIEDREESPMPISQGATLENGTRVRVLRAPYQYAEGVIVSLPDIPQRLTSGLYAWGAEVDLESIGRVFVPYQNLESIR